MLIWAGITLDSFSGPLDLFSCSFTSADDTLNSDGSDFSISVVDASDPNFNQIFPRPSVVARVDTVPATTTTTTTISGPTTTTTTTTTLARFGSLPAGDYEMALRLDVPVNIEKLRVDVDYKKAVEDPDNVDSGRNRFGFKFTEPDGQCAKDPTVSCVTDAECEGNGKCSRQLICRRNPFLPAESSTADLLKCTDDPDPEALCDDDSDCVGKGQCKKIDSFTFNLLNATISGATRSDPLDLFICRFTTTRAGLLADGSDFTVNVVLAWDAERVPVGLQERDVQVRAIAPAVADELPAGEWKVVTRLDQPGDFRSITWKVSYPTDFGSFKGSGPNARFNCELEPDLVQAPFSATFLVDDKEPPDGFAIFNVSVNGSDFPGPRDLVTCPFISEQPGLKVNASDFVVTVNEATDGNGDPVSPADLPQVVVLPIEHCGDRIKQEDRGEVCDDGGGNGTGEGFCLGNCLGTQVCGDEIVNGTEDCETNKDTRRCDADCTEPQCGDHHLNPVAGEECDDGNDIDGDGCDSDCTVSECGNGIRTDPEFCDDGDENGTDEGKCLSDCSAVQSCGDGRTDGPPLGTELCDDAGESAACNIDCTPFDCGDGKLNTTAGELCDDGGESAACDIDCTPSDCGDGTLNTTAGEGCDDGNLTDGDDCDSNCTATGCGNGIRTDPEECDDGQNNSDTLADACRTDCNNARCGDGVEDSGEECDEGSSNSAAEPDACRTDCNNARCGDGVRDSGEDCDDGNNIDGDGCLSTCSDCGNGELGLGEQCDDGNAIDGDDCDSNCTRPRCGNGVVVPGEDCDDSGESPTCNIDCTQASCGDGKLNRRSGEECDDGNTVPDDGCDSLCQLEVPLTCGDGTIDPGEQCDDENHSNWDYCTNECRCAVCGDGFVRRRGTTPVDGCPDSNTVTPLEKCDDGNTARGDGCAEDCTLECGNGTTDRTCVLGDFGAACSIDSDCDTGLGAGDGLCMGEGCDPGTGGFCGGGAGQCSNLCRSATSCGNGFVECGEECDLGRNMNGAEGSGCTDGCKRVESDANGAATSAGVIGRREGKRPWECLGAWTLDSPPLGLEIRNQVCTDGDDSCDFDRTAGKCTFRVGYCLDLSSYTKCTPGKIESFDLRKVRVTDPERVRIVEDLLEAVARLSPGPVRFPGRCRKGLRRKTCSEDHECARSFGGPDGICDVGTGVVFVGGFLPPDESVGQALPNCTPGVDIAVRAGSSLKLKSWVRRLVGKSDKDRLRLSCRRAL